MKKIHVAKNKYALIDDEDFERVSKHDWHIELGYACSYDGKPRIRMARFITNCPKGMYVDHVNHNRLDNQKKNLRVCTPRENCHNRQKQKGTKYPYKGISICGYRNDKYRAYLAFIVDGKIKKYWATYRVTVEEAALDYNILAKKHFGEFACLNVIK